MGQFVFIIGLVITFVLYALKVRAALIISILATTIIAIVTGVQPVDTSNLVVDAELLDARPRPAGSRSRSSPSSASSRPS